MDVWGWVELALILLAAMGVAVAWLYDHAPRGFEDSQGFHYGDPPASSDWRKWD